MVLAEYNYKIYVRELGEDYRNIIILENKVRSIYKTKDKEKKEGIRS